MTEHGAKLVEAAVPPAAEPGAAERWQAAVLCVCILVDVWV